MRSRILLSAWQRRPKQTQRFQLVPCCCSPRRVIGQRTVSFWRQQQFQQQQQHTLAVAAAMISPDVSSLPWSIRSFSDSKMTTAEPLDESVVSSEALVETTTTLPAETLDKTLRSLLDRLSKIDTYTLGSHKKFMFEEGISPEMSSVLNFVSSGEFDDSVIRCDSDRLGELLHLFVQNCGQHTTHKDLLNDATENNGMELLLDQDGVTEDIIVEMWRNFETMSIIHNIWKKTQQQHQSQKQNFSVEAFQALVAQELDHEAKLWEQQGKHIDELKKEVTTKLYMLDLLSLLNQPASLGFFAEILKQIQKHDKEQDPLHPEKNNTSKPYMAKKILFTNDDDDPYHENPQALKQLRRVTTALIQVLGVKEAESFIPTKDLAAITSEQKNQVAQLSGLSADVEVNQHAAYLGMMEMALDQWKSEQAKDILRESASRLEPVSLEVLQQLSSSKPNDTDDLTSLGLNEIVKVLELKKEDQEEEEGTELYMVAQAILKFLEDKKKNSTDFLKIVSLTDKDKDRIMQLAFGSSDESDEIVLTKKELESYIADVGIILGILQHQPLEEEEEEEFDQEQLTQGEGRDSEEVEGKQADKEHQVPVTEQHSKHEN